MRKLTLWLLVFVFSTASFAATKKDISYKSGNETVNAVLYTPNGSGPFPALVVIHEWWGLNDWVKEQAQKLADQGYETLAIDLYRGKVATTPEEAHEIMRGVPEDRANRDLLAAYDYLASQSNVKKDKIGAIGWCMGGGYALDLAIAQPKLAVDVINYGHLATDDSTLQKINAKVLGIFGGQDLGITPDSVRAFEQQMKKLGKSVETKIYPDAGHAFENPNNKAGYKPEDAKAAWDLTLKFLNENLKS